MKGRIVARGFQEKKKSTYGEYINKIQEASHGQIFTFLFHLDKNGEKENRMTRVTVL